MDEKGVMQGAGKGGFRHFDSLIYMSFLYVVLGELALLNDVGLGLIVYGSMVFVLVAGVGFFHGCEAGAGLDRAVRYRNASDLMKVLVLLPVSRLVFYALPLHTVPYGSWPLVAGAVMLVAVLAVLRNAGLRAADLLGRPEAVSFLLMCFTGALYGFAGYLVAGPAESFTVSPDALFLAGLMLDGLLAETVFRGMIQGVSQKLYGGPTALFYAGLLYVVMNVRSYAPAEVAYLLVVSLSYGAFYWKRRDLAGIGISHGLLNIVLYYVAPVLLAGV